MFFATLVGLGGASLDVGNWYLHIERTQRAADAAALAGAVSVPGHPDTAISVAKTVLEANNVDPTTATDIGPNPGRPDRMDVTLHSSVRNYFLSIFGFKTFSYDRTSHAGYLSAINMGSPDNSLGQEPGVLGSTWSNSGSASNFFIGQNTAMFSKSEADRWNTNGCATSPPDPVPDLCDGTNNEYIPGGSQFIVDTTGITSGNLAVEAFDPLYAQTFAGCQGATYKNLYKKFPAGTMPVNYSPTHTTDDAAKPSNGGYAIHPEICTGDYGGSGPAGTPRSTEFSLWTPADSPGGSTEIATTTCQPRAYTPLPNTNETDWYNNYLKDPPSSIYSTAPNNTFHKWARVCTLPIDSDHPAGKYILRVVIDQSTTTQLKNRYALRAAILDDGGVVDTTASAKVGVHAADHLTLVVHSAATPVTFYLAKVQPAAAGRTAHVEVYDMGEGGLKYFELKWANGSSVQSCKVTWLNNTYPGINSNSGCKIDTSGIYGRFNSHIVSIDVPIPENYDCNSADSSCWLLMDLKYLPLAASGEDGTSWKVSINGGPVRLWE
jgi:hypothetical protein